MRIRYPFAGAFCVILLLAAYVGFLPHNEDGGSSIPPSLQPNDKFLHFITFFVLSMAFYWIIDTTRRRTLHLSVLVCTLILGVGSEIIQALIPNGRSFDPFDVLANVVGSLGAIGLCTWYHKRMLERRRKARFGALLEEAHEDVELGLSSVNEENHIGPQETGVTTTTTTRTLEQEVDNWDENAVDEWDEADDDVSGPQESTGPTKTSSGSKVHHEPDDMKKRTD
ncbi:hypothetical protein VTO42DRAFT_5372 [Malbranchea cinnamomea]